MFKYILALCEIIPKINFLMGNQSVIENLYKWQSMFLIIINWFYSQPKIFLNLKKGEKFIIKRLLFKICHSLILAIFVVIVSQINFISSNNIYIIKNILNIYNKFKITGKFSTKVDKNETHIRCYNCGLLLHYYYPYYYHYWTTKYYTTLNYHWTDRNKTVIPSLLCPPCLENTNCDNLMSTASNHKEI